MKTNKVKILILALITGLMLTGCTATKTAKTSETQKQDTAWMFHDIVDANFVKANISVPMPENVMVVDARPFKVKYTKGHIPGAINISFSEFDKKTDLLPKDKNDLLIFYCGGLKCKLSHKAAKKAEKLGYKNVKVYAKGYPDWISQKGNYGSVSAEFVAKQIAGNKTLIVDARPQKPKFDKGHIPTAINIPFTHFEALKGKLPRDLNTPVIFYCGGLKCRLSHKSAAKALEMGYTDIKVFDKGYPEWKKAYGQSSAALRVKAGAAEGSIDLERFKSIIANNPESIMLIDVRDA
ncbi:MAG: rhodanese-like domain-containing protein, partial [Desulfobacteraceae bacterium]|nr:rhodanese-like domain-containing protein [Desulfobacteraceae bacterium]